MTVLVCLRAAVRFSPFTDWYEVCEIEFSHMDRNSGNPDLVCMNTQHVVSSFLFSKGHRGVYCIIYERAYLASMEADRGGHSFQPYTKALF